MSEQRQYPRQAWIVMPSYRIREVTVTKPAYRSSCGGWDALDNGAAKHTDDLHPNRQAAIAAARASIAKAQEDLTKRQTNLKARIEQLDKEAQKP